MGITHLAHINGYYGGNCKFDIYDPSFLYNFFSLTEIRPNIHFLHKIPESGHYDSVIITSPPKAHAPNFLATIDLADDFFIEKPLSFSVAELNKLLRGGKRVTCGYVLRHNPCVAYLRDTFGATADMTVSVDVQSNLGLNVGQDWRSDMQRGGGCINEFGSHAVNLVLDFVNYSQLADESCLQLQVDTLDIGAFDVSIGATRKLRVSGDWNKDIRKTTYNLELNSESFTLRSDLQSVWGICRGEEINWSPRQSPLHISYYMRGIDFALQNSSFLSHEYKQKDLADAALTDKILVRVIEHG